MADPAYCSTLTINASYNKVVSYFTDMTKLATLDNGHMVVTGSAAPPAVGETRHYVLTSVPAPFDAVFSKAGETTKGTHELEWTGSIPCLASFIHGFTIVASTGRHC